MPFSYCDFHDVGEWGLSASPTRTLLSLFCCGNKESFMWSPTLRRLPGMHGSSPSFFLLGTSFERVRCSLQLCRDKLPCHMASTTWDWVGSISLTLGFCSLSADINHILQLSYMPCFFSPKNIHVEHIKDPNIEELTHGRFLHMFLPCLTEQLIQAESFIFPLDSVRLGTLKCPQVQNDAMYVSVRCLRELFYTNKNAWIFFILISHHRVFPRKQVIEFRL